jgi:SPP1 gp7 family putative phage head morphogenesis protein
VKRKPKRRPLLPTYVAGLFAAELAHRAECIRCARQPSTLYGSPEVIVDLGVDRGVVVTASWAERIVDAIGDASTVGEIRARMRRATAGNELAPFAKIARERILHGAMLGALDSNWEGETGGVVEPARFVDVAAVPSFAKKPFEEAISFFRSKRILSPVSFRRLEGAAKVRSFSIARAANQELLAAAHAELERQLREGADLRSFKEFARDRMEKAGWVPANKSHVELIFRNNVVGAYSQGRKAEMTQPLVLKARPVWQVRGVDDARQRDNHRKVNGVAVRADDPVWNHLWTPFGMNCRCRITSRSEADVKRLNIEVRGGDALAPVPDPGWETLGRAA